MYVRTVVPPDHRWALTLQGVDALLELETCQCPDLMVADGCYQCWECGTVYGIVFGYARLPRRNRRRVKVA